MNPHMMERKGSTASSSGIIVEREITISNDDFSNGMPNSRRPSVVSTIRSVPETQRDSRVLDHLRPGTPPLRLDGLMRHPDVREERLGDLLDERRDEESLRYLIDFLKKTPPPNSFMSQPEDYSSSSDSDNKWKKKFKVFRKKRRVRRRRIPPVIRLPDSAIAAKTTGGYRHIAISIPFEYSHLGPLPKSQYPIFSSMEADFHREIETRFGNGRSYGNDRAITILKPVQEDRESITSAGDLSSLSPASIGHGRNSSLAQSIAANFADEGGAISGYPDKPISPRSSHTVVEGLNETTNISENHGTAAKTTRLSTRQLEKLPEGVLGAREEPSASKAVVVKAHQRTTSQLSSSSGSNMSPLPISPPFRTSSKNAPVLTNDPADSIDRILSQQQNPPSRGTFGYHQSASESAGAESEATIQPTKTVRPLSSIPIVVRPPSPSRVLEAESPLNFNFPSPPSHISRSVQTELNASDSNTSSVRSRKDRVRLRKERDVMAMKAQRQDSTSSSTPRLNPPSVANLPESPILGHFSDSLKSRPSSMNSMGSKRNSTSMNSLGSKRNSKPPPIKILPKAEAEVPRHSPTEVIGKAENVKGSRRLSTWLSPPSSPGSPPVSWDRTSYHRRKERKAERDARENRRAKYVAKALAEHQENSERLSRHELLDRYETLKEVRIHDMEKRLKRLERNSDVWLRSMIPMMESINALLHEQYDLSRSTVYQLQPVAIQHPAVLRSQRADSLRSFRSFESPLDYSRLNLSNPNVKTVSHHRRRPTDVAASGAESVRRRVSPENKGRGRSAAPAIPHHSPLQEEFEKEMAEKRLNEEREDEIDRRMLETDHESAAEEAGRSKGKSKARSRGAYIMGLGLSSHAGEGLDDDSLSTTSSSNNSSSTTGLENLEPLMRELQDNARMSLERHRETPWRGVYATR